MSRSRGYSSPMPPPIDDMDDPYDIFIGRITIEVGYGHRSFLIKSADVDHPLRDLETELKAVAGTRYKRIDDYKVILRVFTSLDDQSMEQILDNIKQLIINWICK